jgi:branched-chain amino acid transport system substrate-binding protein
MSTQPPSVTPPSITRRTILGTVALAASSSVHAAVRPAQPPPITLAAVFPDHGGEALAGDEAWRGTALAIAAANQGRKTPIRLLRTTTVDPSRHIADLAKSNPPAAFLGTQSSTVSFAATAAAELDNIPYIELDAPADAITTRGFKMLLRTGLTTTALAARTIGAIAGQIAPAWHKSTANLRIAILFDDGATNGAFAAAMLDLAHQTKLPILLMLGYGTNTMDLASEIARMKRARIDLLIHAGRTEHVLLAYQAMATAAWRPRMIIGIGTGYGMSAIGFTLGSALENTMVVDAPLYAATGPSAAIAHAYQDRYARPPRSSASLTSYVGTMLVIAALDSGKPLIDTLRATNNPRSTLANGWGVAFNGDGQNRESFATLQQWRAGTLITIDPTVTGAAKERAAF